jgi:hypothetical protein
MEFVNSLIAFGIAFRVTIDVYQIVLKKLNSNTLVRRG